jgi:hypothetical protein
MLQSMVSSVWSSGDDMNDSVFEANTDTISQFHFNIVIFNERRNFILLLRYFVFYLCVAEMMKHVMHLCS